MNGKLNVKPINNFDQAPLLSSVGQWNTHSTTNLLLVTYHLPFHEVRLIEGRPWTILLNHEKLSNVNQNLLTNALKNKFSTSSVFFFPIDVSLYIQGG